VLFRSWLTIFVASIASLISSIILMVIFWLPKEPENTTRAQRNWQMYSLFIQIFAFIFLIIDYFTS
jgi:Na+/melibiose symporter-like transporter